MGVYGEMLASCAIELDVTYRCEFVAMSDTQRTNHIARTYNPTGGQACRTLTLQHIPAEIQNLGLRPQAVDPIPPATLKHALIIVSFALLEQLSSSTYKVHQDLLP